MHRRRHALGYQKVLWGGAALLLLVALFVANLNEAQTPDKVFWGMLENNLATTGVTKHITQSGQGKSLNQYVRFTMGSNNASQWLAQLQDGSSVITTDSIGTPGPNYIEYTAIKSPLRKANGQAADFSNVLNVWAKDEGGSKAVLPTLFPQAVLDVTIAPMPPIGNLPAAQRHAILAYMRDHQVYTLASTAPVKQTANGRQIYIYTINAHLTPYLQMMQQYATYLGIHALDNIQPDNYKTFKPVVLTLGVDSLSRQLVQATSARVGYSETFSSYGLTEPIGVPDAAISISQLQSRLQQDQQGTH